MILITLMLKAQPTVAKIEEPVKQEQPVVVKPEPKEEPPIKEAMPLKSLKAEEVEIKETLRLQVFAEMVTEISY